MQIQLAIDRLSIQEGIAIAEKAREHADWIEVGTSLIKEYGMESVRRFKEAFPEKVILADMKTMDNAIYEMDICFQAGADAATVMGAAPFATVEQCMAAADKAGKKLIIDLLGTDEEEKKKLYTLKNAILCFHISKDQQEHGKPEQLVIHKPAGLQQKTAAAGGISMETLDEIAAYSPDILIIGSAITKAEDPEQAAAAFAEKIKQKERM